MIDKLTSSKRKLLFYSLEKMCKEHLTPIGGQILVQVIEMKI